MDMPYSPHTQVQFAVNTRLSSAQMFPLTATEEGPHMLREPPEGRHMYS